MNFSPVIQSLSVVAALALAGCVNTETPSEPAASALSKTTVEIPKTGCGPIDDMASEMTTAFTCSSGDFDDCLAGFVKKVEPVLACYEVEIPSGFSSRAEFQKWGEDLGDKAKEYEDPAKAEELYNCVCGGGKGGFTASANVKFDGGKSTSATGYSSGKSTSATGYSSGKSTSATGYSSVKSTSASGFNPK